MEYRRSVQIEPFNIRTLDPNSQLILKNRLEKTLKQMDVPNPLDLIHTKEIEEISVNDKVIKNHLNDKKYLDSKLPVIQFEELKLISIKIAPSSSYNSVAPSALAASANYILIGNTSGQILVFNQDGHEIRVLKPKKGLGQVTCMDISSDECFLIAGYHFGQICLWDLTSGKSKKVSKDLHKCPILSIKFWKGFKDYVISGDLSGRVLLVEFQKGLVSMSIASIELFKDEVGPVLSIEPLNPEPMWPHPTDTHRIVAIAGLRRIAIFTLEPDIQKILLIDKPPGVSDSVCPCISWKLGMAPDDPMPLHHILAVSWGQRIVLYTFKFAGAEGVIQSGYLENDTEIKAMHWLSYEILVALNLSREIRILSSREFSNKLGESGRRAVLEETYANRDLALQSYLKSDKKENYTYHNTLKAQNRVIYLLGNKEFHKGQLMNWKECLDELTRKNEWLDALALALNLYLGKGKKLYGVPRDKDELRYNLCDYIIKFIKVILMPWTLKIPVIIEYCVGIEALDYFFDVLFDQILDLTSTTEDTKLLIEYLEPYILQGLITSVPPKNLSKIIDFYLNSKQHTHLERILLHLEPTCFDPKTILPACENHNLLNAYIFINTNSTMQSFVNPLKKMYKTLIKQKDPRAKLYFNYKLLWYFRLCLRGETFPSGKILPELIQEVIGKVVSWLLKRKHLENLLNMDSIVALNVVWLIFEENVPKEVMLSGKYKGYMDIINKLGEICKPGSFLFHQYQIFVLKTSNLPHITLGKDIYIENAKYVLKFNRPASFETTIGANIDEYINNYVKLNDKNQLLGDFSYEEKAVMLLKLLKKHPLDHQEVEDLHKFAEETAYTEVLIYLLELKKEYSKCVKCFITCNSEEVRKKVFAWLNQIFKSISEYERNDLTNDLMIHLNKLVEIDSDQTSKLVTDWYQNKHLEIVRKLNNAPKLQMKYLGELVKDNIDEDLIFKYVVLLCQHDPGKVLPFLESREDYNFDKCLQECTTHQVVEGAAFLHEKMGNIKDALDLMINRAQKNKTDYLNKINAFELIEAIEKDTKECIKLCARNTSRLDLTELDEYLFNVLEMVLDMYREFNHLFDTNPNIENIIHRCIKELLEEMMNHIDFKKIITYIIDRFEHIPFKHIKENIFQILSQHSYQKSIVRRAINLLTNDVKSMTRTLYNIRSKGVNAEEICRKCSLTMHSEKKERCIIFICGHGYHLKCVKQGQCYLCSMMAKKGTGLLGNN